MTLISVEEVAGEKHAGDEHQQQAQVEAGAVQLNGQVVGIGIALHGFEESAADKLHGSQGPQEKDRGNAESMQGQPAHRENRVIARRGGGWGGGHVSSQFLRRKSSWDLPS